MCLLSKKKEMKLAKIGLGFLLIAPSVGMAEVDLALSDVSKEELDVIIRGDRGTHYKLYFQWQGTFVGEYKLPAFTSSTDYISNGREERLSLGSPRFGVLVQAVATGEYTSLDAPDAGPIPRFQPTPIYPEALQRQGISGEVRMTFIIEVDGTTSDIETVSSTHEAFAQAAIAAIERWRLEPVRENGVPLRSRVYINIPFRTYYLNFRN